MMYCPYCKADTGKGEPLAHIGTVGYCKDCDLRFVLFFRLRDTNYNEFLAYDRGCDE